MGSTRLPGKVLRPLCDSTVLGYVIDRCKQCRSIDEIIVATSDMPADDAIVNYLQGYDVPVFRGSEKDVLRRYVQAAEKHGVRDIVRVTADCPLIDPDIVDEVVDLYLSERCDYAYIEGYPRGMGEAEVVFLEALHRTMKITSEEETTYREHVITYVIKHPNLFRVVVKRAPEELTLPDSRVCVDEEADLDVIRHVAEKFFPRKNFATEEVIEFLRENPEIRHLNINVRQKKF